MALAGPPVRKFEPDPFYLSIDAAQSGHGSCFCVRSRPDMLKTSGRIEESTMIGPARRSYRHYRGTG